MTDLLANAMPVQGLIGGLMIGTASAIMLLGLGRIAGVSGLAARATGITVDGAPRPLAIAFVVGLPLGALLVALILGPVETRFERSWHFDIREEHDDRLRHLRKVFQRFISGSGFETAEPRLLKNLIDIAADDRVIVDSQGVRNG